MPSLTADPASADVRSFSDWQELAARDPELAARELSRRLQMSLSPDQRRACFANVSPPEILTSVFQRVASVRLRSRGKTQLPLAGVPFTLKDLYSVSGQVARAGSNFPIQLLPSSAHAGKLPHALEVAGAVLAGRTNLYEFAYGLTGENAHFGDCEHPYFPGRTSGGSSSGAAVSVAAGIVPLAIGTDTGGSIRVPAAFCGLFGMRLTPGDAWISDAFPLAPAFDTAGWLTRSAADMEIVNGLLLRSTPPVQTYVRASVPPFEQSHGKGVDGDLRGCFLDLAALDHRAAENASREFVRVLRDASKRFAPAADKFTREQIFHAFHGSLEAYAILQSTQAFKVHERWLDKHKAHYSTEVWKRIDRGRRWSASQLDAAHIKQRSLQDFWKSFFKTYDFLVMPATPFTALSKAECTQANRDHLLALMVPASLGGLPVLTVPVILPSGLSTGLQIIVRDPHSPVLAWALKRAV